MDQITEHELEDRELYASQFRCALYVTFSSFPYLDGGEFGRVCSNILLLMHQRVMHYEIV